MQNLNVIRELEISKAQVLLWIENTTRHARSERQNRFSRLDKENLQVYKAFEVDKQHINGNEIHVITWQAEILIFNLETKRAITVLFARPRQITRYQLRFARVPQTIMEKAYRNLEMGYNNL